MLAALVCTVLPSPLVAWLASRAAAAVAAAVVSVELSVPKLDSVARDISVQGASLVLVCAGAADLAPAPPPFPPPLRFRPRNSCRRRHLLMT